MVGAVETGPMETGYQPLPPPTTKTDCFWGFLIAGRICLTNNIQSSRAVKLFSIDRRSASRCPVPGARCPVPGSAALRIPKHRSEVGLPFRSLTTHTHSRRKDSHASFLHPRRSNLQRVRLDNRSCRGTCGDDETTGHTTMSNVEPPRACCASGSQPHTAATCLISWRRHDGVFSGVDRDSWMVIANVAAIRLPWPRAQEMWATSPSRRLGRGGRTSWMAVDEGLQQVNLCPAETGSRIVSKPGLPPKARQVDVSFSPVSEACGAIGPVCPARARPHDGSSWIPTSCLRRLGAGPRPTLLVVTGPGMTRSSLSGVVAAPVALGSPDGRRTRSPRRDSSSWWSSAGGCCIYKPG